MPAKSHGNYGKLRSYDPSIVSNVLDLVWAAGFLEGEGSFKHNSNKNPSPQITAAQVQAEPLQRLQNLFGGYLSLYDDTRSDRQKINKWGISGERARCLMLDIFSVMSPRRQAQIQEVRNACGF